MDHSKRCALTLIALFAPLLHAGERQIDPTFLYRDPATVKEKHSDITTATCHYKPLFGQGDSDTSVVVGVARYGEAIIDPKGECAPVQYPGEDQVYVILDGSASVKYETDTVPLKTEDYLYIPSTISHAASNPSAKPLTVLVMGFRTKGFEPTQLPPHPLHANIEDVPTNLVKGHPSSSLFRLLMGDVDSKRDRIAAGRVLTSSFSWKSHRVARTFPTITSAKRKSIWS